MVTATARTGKRALARERGRILDVKISSVRPSVVAAYAAVTASIPLMLLSVSLLRPIERVEPVDVEAVERAAALAEGPSDAEAVRALAGLWWKALPGLEGSDVGFYYFHGDGKGLYRYGKVGLVNTHSFDYDVAGGILVLEFRKSGVRHELPFSLESEGSIDWLTLAYDPETQTQGARYFRDRPGPIDPHRAVSSDLGQAPAGHMWIDLDRYATGGIGFHMYQFRPAGIDGRGVGWFHRGDFDDWTTEAFTYRIAGEQLAMHFTLADRTEVSGFEVDAGEPRTLRFEADPRDFWHPHAYLDMGASFGTAPAAAWAMDVPYKRTE